MLNFYLNYVNLFVFSVIQLWSTWGFNPRSMYTYYYDYLSRGYSDDFFLNNYYYFWTSFWYIPTLVFIFFVLYIYSSDFFLIPFHKIWISIPIIIYYEILDYWLMSVKEYDLFICSDHINTLLLNSINKYHPFIFYYSTLLTIVFTTIVICSNFVTCRKYFANENIIYKLLDYSVFNYIAINFTLFLGSWWALQEGSWGGWWNWDPSEVFGMVIMIFTSLNIHYCDRGGFRNSYRYLFIYYFIVSTLLYIFIQLNFNLVSHNFGIRSSEFVNTIQLFFIVFLVLILRIISVVKAFSTGLKYFIVYMNSGIIIIFLGVVYRTRYIFYGLSLVITILLSFYPLINDFLWKINCISVLNIPINFPNLIIFIIIYTYLVFFSFNPYYILILLYSTKLDPYFTVLVIILYLLNLYYSIHTNILVILILNFINCSKVLVNWSVFVKSGYLDSLYGFSYVYNTTPSIFNNNLEFCSISTENFRSYTNSIVTYTESTSPNNNQLYLSSNGSYILQVLSGGMFYSIFSITITDSSVQLVYLLWITNTSLFIFYFRKNILIVF